LQRAVPQGGVKSFNGKEKIIRNVRDEYNTGKTQSGLPAGSQQFGRIENRDLL